MKHIEQQKALMLTQIEQFKKEMQKKVDGSKTTKKDKVVLYGIIDIIFNGFVGLQTAHFDNLQKWVDKVKDLNNEQ